MRCKYCCREFNNLNANRVCSNCSNRIKICKNQDRGCTYQNLSNKCLKHELYYCDYNYECDFPDCDEEICSGELIQHYHLDHDVNNYLNSLAIDINQEAYLQVLTLCADIGYIMCEYYFDNEKLQIYLYSPLDNERLMMNYECEISILDPNYDECVEFSPNCQLFGKEDWFLQINRSNLSFWSYSFTVRINVSRR